jgi:hypothetical protein
MPCAAYATLAGTTVTIDALLASVDGTRVLRLTATGTEPAAVGVAAARAILDDLGGAALLAAEPAP